MDGGRVFVSYISIESDCTAIGLLLVVSLLLLLLLWMVLVDVSCWLEGCARDWRVRVRRCSGGSGRLIVTINHVRTCHTVHSDCLCMECSECGGMKMKWKKEERQSGEISPFYTAKVTGERRKKSKSKYICAFAQYSCSTGFQSVNLSYTFHPIQVSTRFFFRLHFTSTASQRDPAYHHLHTPCALSTKGLLRHLQCSVLHLIHAMFSDLHRLLSV